MEEKNLEITCIVAPTMRELLKQANRQAVKKEDIVSIFSFEGQVYMVYYE